MDDCIRCNEATLRVIRDDIPLCYLCDEASTEEEIERMSNG